MLRRIFDRLAGGRRAQPAQAPAAAARPPEFVAEGNALLAEGRLDEAAESFRKAVQADPRSGIAHLNLGYVLLEQGKVAEAAPLLQQALALHRPGDDFIHDAHFLLARAQRQQGHAAEALASLERAVAARPRFDPAIAEALDILHALGRHADALVQAEAWARDSGGSPDALLAVAHALHAQQRSAEALEAVEAVLSVVPDHPAALEGRAVLRLARGEAREALQDLQAASARTPPHPQLLSNLAAALHQCGRLDEALQHADQALALDAGHRDAAYNRARILLDLLRLPEAEATLCSALERYPHDDDLRWNRAVVRLLRGDLAQGWRDYDARWRAVAAAASTGAPTLQRPRWRGGEDLAGRSIVVLPEQGLGDSIQFARFLPVLRARGARVVFRASPPLQALFRASFPDCTIVGDAEPVPASDFEVPLLDLPGALGGTLESIPNSVPYLRSAPPERQHWQERLGAAVRPRVGLVWSGSTGHGNDANRSIPLQVFSRIAVDGVDFVSLQKEVRPGDAAALAGWPGGLAQFGSELASMADTAALVEAMDLVISVDTSVAHLAGALGKPVWILLPHVPDWRWMLEREDSPWYPTAKLFRQPAPAAWEPVLERVRAGLQSLRTAA